MDCKESININDLINIKNSKIKEKWELYRKYQDMDEVIKKLESEIYKKCNHKWKRDDYSYGPYDKAEYICEHCSLYRNDYMYN